ncbi:MAG: hypothetical protein ACYTJ0_17175 [Planctomycetota bacterium]|jgi:hypothetical protein
MLTSVLLLHAGATLAMAGLIWFVQIVHYPLMADVGAAGFVPYEHRHVRLTTTVVGPLMLTELVTALIIAVGDGTALAWAGLGLVGLVWASTAMLQVPCHRQLEQGFDAEIIRRLVATNWLRTAAWSARGVIALLLLAPPDATV